MLFHVSVVCSFLLLNSFPLYGFTTVCFTKIVFSHYFFNLFFFLRIFSLLWWRVVTPFGIVSQIPESMTSFENTVVHSLESFIQQTGFEHLFSILLLIGSYFQGFFFCCCCFPYNKNAAVNILVHSVWVRGPGFLYGICLWAGLLAYRIWNFS